MIENDMRVLADVDIGATIPPGNHWLRVVTPGGVTNRMLFRVNVDPVIEESKVPHAISTKPNRSSIRWSSTERSTRRER